MTREEFLEGVRRFQISYTGQRYGQAVWNYAASWCRDPLIEEAAHKVNAHPDLDPFHKDELVPAFLDYLPLEESRDAWSSKVC